MVKITMQEVPDAREFRAAMGGQDVREIESFCTDPVWQRYEFNFRLPVDVRKGPHEVHVSLGKRKFAPLGIEVA
jgi:hypothetical protein